MPKPNLTTWKEHTEAEERRKTLEKLSSWILHKIVEIILFVADVYQCNIAFSVLYACAKLFYIYFHLFLYLFIASKGSG